MEFQDFREHSFTSVMLRRLSPGSTLASLVAKRLRFQLLKGLKSRKGSGTQAGPSIPGSLQLLRSGLFRFGRDPGDAHEETEIHP